MRALLRSRRRLRARLTALHEREVARTRRQALLLELTARRLAERLAAEGIASLPMKGPFLGEAVYGDPGRRPAADIDLLVAPEHLWRAVAIAREAGYAPPEDPLDGDGMPLLHCALRHERGQLPPLELHWRVHWHEREFAAGALARSAARPSGVHRALPADELACLLLFYARDGFSGLRLACDIAAWWEPAGRGSRPARSR